MAHPVLTFRWRSVWHLQRNVKTQKRLILLAFLASLTGTTIAIVEGSQRTLVVLEPVCRFWFHHEQHPVRLQQQADFLEGRLRCGEIVDAVTGGDEIETTIHSEIAGGLDHE